MLVVKAKYLYHLSYSPNLKVMKPMYQKNAASGEPIIERICFSKTIIGCFYAVNLYNYGKNKHRMYLYRTKEPVTYALPYGVTDAKVSGEVWRFKETEVVKIGSFHPFWLTAIPCVSRGSKYWWSYQKQDIRTIRRVFCHSHIVFKFRGSDKYIRIRYSQLKERAEKE